MWNSCSGKIFSQTNRWHLPARNLFSLRTRCLKNFFICTAAEVLTCRWISLAWSALWTTRLSGSDQDSAAWERCERLIGTECLLFTRRDSCPGEKERCWRGVCPCVPAYISPALCMGLVLVSDVRHSWTRVNKHMCTETRTHTHRETQSNTHTYTHTYTQANVFPTK